MKKRFETTPKALADGLIKAGFSAEFSIQLIVEIWTSIEEVKYQVVANLDKVMIEIETQFGLLADIKTESDEIRVGQVKKAKETIKKILGQ